MNKDQFQLPSNLNKQLYFNDKTCLNAYKAYRSNLHAFKLVQYNKYLLLFNSFV